MSQPPIRPQLAASAAIFRDGKLLLVRRANAPGRGLYSLPGGRVEFGETIEQAVHREVDEETSLKIAIAGFAAIREVLPADGVAGHFVVLSYAARWLGGEVRLNQELDDFRWIDPDRLHDFSTTVQLDLSVAAARRVIGL